MNDEDRRELMARQHRALYGNEAGAYYERGNFGEDNHTPLPSTQPPGASSSAASAREPSPLTYNSFGLNQNQVQSASSEPTGPFSASDQTQPNNSKGPSPKPQQVPPQRSRANSTSSPASNAQSFSRFENAAQQSSRTSTSSPGGSPPRPAGKSATAPIGTGVAPIGTRPQNQAVNPVLNKRSTTPLPSPLSYGFAPNESLTTSSAGNERSTSAASNPPAGAKDSNMGSMGWGSSSAVWGKNPLGVQASVWG